MNEWPPELPEEAFTRRVVAWLAQRFPGSSFSFLDALGLRIEHPDGSRRDARLDHLWRSYKQSPDTFADALEHYAKAVDETFEPETPGLEAVVPLVRSLGWVREVHAALGFHEASQHEPVVSPLVADLCVVLAFDRKHGIQVLRREDLERLGREPNALLTRGLENLAKRLPEPKLEGGDPIGYVTAGGNYESSLLLFDGLWAQLQDELEGDLLAAAPSRDVVLFADAASPGARDQLAELTEAAFQEASYPVSTSILRFTPQGWVAA